MLTTAWRVYEGDGLYLNPWANCGKDESSGTRIMPLFGLAYEITAESAYT